MERVTVSDKRNLRTVLPDGTEVGGYLLTHHGFGGMSTVYKGVKEDQTFLVKEVAGDNSFQLLALTQEKGLLERINHPGIVRFHGLFEENGYYYMVQEFIEGRSLEDRQDNGPPLTEAEVRDWATQLCDIFAYLHRLDPPIIYKDLKPGNVILQGDRVRLIDFGIARVYKGDKIQDTELLGSFFTASPEHFGGVETDPRSDIFTLGATLYDLLSEGKDRHQLPSNHPPLRELAPDVSPELEAIVMKALATAPEDRFQTMDEMHDALQPGAKKVKVPPRRRPAPKWAWPAVAAVLLALLLATGLAASQRGAPQEEGPTEDTGLIGSVFGDRPDGVVTLGEEIGLFRKLPAAEAPQLVERLNRMYHTQCPYCRVYRLEPKGIRIGTYVDPKTRTRDTALFYAHNDPLEDGTPQWREICLLTKVDQAQADALKSTRKHVAGYWRDLLRDLVEISRGREGGHSPLGASLQQEMLAARRKLGPEASMDNLWQVLQQLSSQKTIDLRTEFEHVPPDYRCEADRFQELPDFEPLKS